MAHPLFSCVVPVKGERPYFDAAIASLHAQNMGDDLEIIIQDADVEPDRGQSDALNKGFSKAKGEWFFWLNADDVLLPGVLEKVKDLSLSRTPTSKSDSLNWIAGNVAYLDETGRVIRCAWDRGSRSSYHRMPVQVYGPSSFFRRSLYEMVGPFDVSLHYAMDVDLWCRFRKAGYWYTKIRPLTWGFRIHKGSKTHEAQRGGWPKEVAAEQSLIDKRYGIADSGFDRRLAQFTRIVNGSYVRSYALSRKYQGHGWKDIQAL